MLEAKIRYQVACEEKAHRLVLQLLEPGITEDELVDAGLYITPDHYQDITEERAISRMCGYPVCLNQIKKLLNQKYHISTKTNKVYDITDRKNFCSNECYKASVYYQKQISTSPLWSRKEEKPKPIDLLPKELNRGAMGKEVINQQTEMFREAKHLREEEKKEQSQKQTTMEKESGTVETEGEERNSVKGDKNIDDLDLDIQKLNIQENQSVEICNDERKKSRNSAKSKKNIINVKQETSVRSSVTPTDNKQMEKVDRLMALLDRRKNLLGKLVQDERTVAETPAKTQKETVNEDTAEECDQPHSINEAQSKCEENVGSQDTEISETKFTPPVSVPDASKRRKSTKKLSTVRMSYLRMVCEIVKEWITPQTLQFVRSPGEEDENEEGPSTLRTEMEAKMREICRRVDHQEATLDDLIGEEDSLDEQLPLRSPAPNYESLRKDTQEFTQRVQDFLAAGKVIKEKEVGTQGPVYLPAVDTYNQMLIRQRIVMEQLNKAIPDLLPPLKLSIQDVFAEIKELVMTFRLTSSNIVFKPVEWSLVGLILLKLLSRRSLHVSCAFLNPSAVQYFSVFLGGIEETLENVDLYVTGLLQHHNKVV